MMKKDKCSDCAYDKNDYLKKLIWYIETEKELFSISLNNETIINSSYSDKFMDLLKNKKIKLYIYDSIILNHAFLSYKEYEKEGIWMDNSLGTPTNRIVRLMTQG